MSEVNISNEDTELNLLDLISTLYRNIKWIVIITLISMIIAVIISVLSIVIPPKDSFMPNVYSPVSTVMLNGDNKRGGLNSLLGDSGMGALAGLAGISSEGAGPTDSELAIKLANTNRFINKIESEYNLSELYETNDEKFPKTALRNIVKKKLSISFSSGILKISYTDIDRNLATDITNKVTQLLEEEFAKVDLIRNSSQFKLAEENKLKVEKEIERLSLELITFQKRHNLIDAEIVFEELMKQMSTMQTSLLQKEVDIESYGFVSNIKDPGYKRLENERSAIINAIEKLEKGEFGNYPPVKELPEIALELEKLKSGIEVQKTVYKTIIQQYETLKLTADGTGPTFQVLEKAEVPEMKSGPSRTKFCTVITFVGLFTSIIFVFIKEALINIKNDPSKLKRIKGVK